MQLYRISPEQYASDLSGEGARMYGGRWNPIGKSVIYTDESPSLAMLEMVAFYAVSGAPPELVLATIEIPDSVVIEKPDLADFPSDWNTRPQRPSSSNFGLIWLESAKTSCLRVPSVVTPIGYGWNYILNPAHPELIGKITITKLIRWGIDPRITNKIL